MDKGDRVRIVKGRQGKDQTGSIFWVGENKYGSGQRFGISGDDGETYWIPEENCEQLEAGSAGFAQEEVSFEFDKGDRVAWKNNNGSGVGTIIWIGDNKHGPGKRVGVRDENMEEAVWLDGRLISKLPDDYEPAPQSNDRVDSWGGGNRNTAGGNHSSGGGYGGGSGDRDAGQADSWGGDSGDPGPPPAMDDAPSGGDHYDNWAANAEDEGDDAGY